MKILKQDAAFVIANCMFYEGIDEFKQKFNDDVRIKNLKLDFEKVPVTVQYKGVMPVELVQHTLPIVGYKSNSLKILYSEPDRRINISSDSYEEDKNTLKEMLSILVEFKLPEISAIGINYSAICSTGKKRLSIFNEKINDKTISNWSKNKGFTTIIPIDLDNFGCLATYTIKRLYDEIKSNSKIKNYVYNIAVNYNFEITSLGSNIRERLLNVEKIVSNIDKLYDDFNNKCKEITDL